MLDQRDAFPPHGILEINTPERFLDKLWIEYLILIDFHIRESTLMDSIRIEYDGIQLDLDSII